MKVTRRNTCGALLTLALAATQSPAAITTTGVISPDVNNSFVYIGYLADGSLTIDAGSTLNNSLYAWVGAGDGVSIFPTASATVTGNGSLWNPNSITVGRFATSTLSVLNGATLLTPGGGSIYGGSSALVDGPNTLWNATLNFGTNITTLGQLTVQNSATINAGMVKVDSAGTLLVTGTGSTLKAVDWFDVGLSGPNTATATIQNGAQLTTRISGIGVYATGQLTLTGSASHWTDATAIDIGSNATGTVHILNGATATTPYLHLGNGTGSGNLVVSGIGSRLDVAGQFYASSSACSVQITNGAVVTTSGATSFGNGTVLPSTSTFLIDNASYATTAAFLVASYSPASLTIQNHGTLVSTGAVSTTPQSAASTGTIIVDGSGSSITCVGMIIGGGLSTGAGALTVKNGATVNTGNLNLGIDRRGLVNLQDATITSPTISVGGSLTGTGIINANVTNAAFLGIGNSVGQLTINGTFSQVPQGHMQVEIASDDAIDLLNISGNATLAGTIDLLFLYTPTGPHTYTFLTAPDIFSTATFTVSGSDISPAQISPDFAHGSFSINIPEPTTLPLLAAASLYLLLRRARTRTVNETSPPCHA